MSKLKEPTEKKSASYARDRRNTYGENSKASRKNIPRAKARVRRAERHAVHQALSVASEAGSELKADTEELETVIADSKLQRLSGFHKHPDIPLGDYLDRRSKRKK